MHISESSAHASPENEAKGEMHFQKSLQELRAIRSQLHYAADYCEKTFVNAKEKKILVENTKEYVTKALVAVVDHLGSVSASLNNSISKTDAFSDAELRINCLKQRLLSCEKYAHLLGLTKVRWNSTLPKLHRRYLTTVTTAGKSNGDVRCGDSNSPAFTRVIDKDELEAEGLPLFLYTCSQKWPSAKSLSSGTTEKEETNSTLALPVRDGLSTLSKGPIPTFQFQRTTSKNGRYALFKKSTYGNDILSLIRRTKRTT
ncbi:hypothetical protein Tsubulata_031801 [Turnera subulata]|uniref:Protein ABIL5 n=1 Tax=Turnera subulata TaxID=218843 RepID=A0A9Q0JQM1_9ROSI|nr:hypothetical protein Tsubulata_031801 [Turnera subulata]